MPEIAEREGKEASVVPYHVPVVSRVRGCGGVLVRMGSCRVSRAAGRWVALRCDCSTLLFVTWRGPRRTVRCE